MTTTSIGSGSDTLTLKLSEDAYRGDAQFTVSVDGHQVGGVLTAASAHGSGQSDTVNVLGNWAAGAHAVTVSFLNDAWGGSASTDRNLYVDGATFNGVAVGGAAMTLTTNGPKSFGLTDAGSTVNWGGGSAAQPQVNPGDTLNVTGGTFAAQGGQLSGVTVDLTGTAAAPATLSVQNGTVGALTLVPTANGGAGPASYGTLAVTGTVTVGGALQWGGRSLAPGSLTVSLGQGAVLNLNGGKLADGAAVVVNGASGASVTNAGTLSLANTRQFAIHADLGGTGTIQSVATASSSGVTMELDGAVSAGQTVQIGGGTLLLDQPMRFAGTVAGMVTSAAGGPASQIRLAHSTVTGTSFLQGAGAGDLSIFTRDPGTGAAGTQHIHVAGSFASDAFVFTNDAATGAALIRLAPLA